MKGLLYTLLMCVLSASKIVPGRKEALNTYLRNEGIGVFMSPGRTELCHTFHKYEITKQGNAVLDVFKKFNNQALDFA